MERIPRPGEFYRHFKNRMYQVMQIATHTETGEKLVIYQALYGDFGIYARPLHQFMSPVDRTKYPDAAQKDRFERIVLGRDGEAALDENGARKNFSVLAETGARKEFAAPEQEEPALSPLLMEFLDEDSCEGKLALLQQMKGKVGQREVDSLYVCLDLTARPGTVEEQLENLKQYLKMQQRYDASRLRRR